MIIRFERKPRKKKEFSKLVLGLVMSTYFFGVAFVSAIIFLAVKRGMADIGTLVTALLTFIGAPTATALGWYYWKAKNENMQKNAKASSAIEESGGEENGGMAP